MRIKELLLCSLAITSLVACSNNTVNNEDRDAMKILEEKREYYEKQDRERAKVEEEKTKAMQTAEAGNSEEIFTEDETKLEEERVKNMTADEKLIYRVDKAKEKIDAMLETAKKARQEELDVEETKAKVEEAIKSVTGEVVPEATVVEEAK